MAWRSPNGLPAFAAAPRPPIPARGRRSRLSAVRAAAAPSGRRRSSLARRRGCGALMALYGCALVDVLGAAIRAEGRAFFRHVEEDARMPRPQRRARHRAVEGQVLLAYFDFFTGVSHARCFLSFPVTTSKNAFWIAFVTGPALPAPMTRPSSSRIGVTSAAVPVKKLSLIHISEPTRLLSISYAVFCLKK